MTWRRVRADSGGWVARAGRTRRGGGRAGGSGNRRSAVAEAGGGWSGRAKERGVPADLHPWAGGPAPRI